MAIPTLLREGGPIMPIILGAALVGYLFAIERLLTWGWWHYRERSLSAGENAGDLRRILAGLAAKTPLTPMVSLLSHALRLGQSDPVRNDPLRRDELMQRELLAQLGEVETRISTIGWLGSILPMLGLLGTVSGMIVTFQDLAVTTSRQVLSQGLSQALWTTEVGLLGALPLLAAHHLLTRLKSRWLNRLELRIALLFTPPGELGPAAPEQATGGAAFFAREEPHET
ncbi:MAG: MotA/TolQ/ExbB proton channel family protein [SAR324 cluster bacterium]|nr:MotA/TolQ/ExbB proton channel family protein [SAR324 cluster bacterium]